MLSALSRPVSASGRDQRRSDGRRRAAVMTDVAQARGRLAPDRLARDQRQPTGARRRRASACSRAMRELDYRPNSVARALVTGRSRTLGVVSFDTTLYGPASTLFAIERAAHDAGLLHRASSASSRSTARRCSAPSSGCAAQGVDGILVIAPPGARRRRRVVAPARATSRWSPSRPGPDDAVPVVAVDQVAGAARGHAAPARARPPDRLAHRRARATGSRPRQRIDGWRARARRRPAPTPPPLLVGDWSARSGYELGQRLADRARRHGDLRRQRPDGARRAARPARGGPRGPGRRQRRRLRRHPRGAVLHAAADDRAPGLQRDRAAEPSCSCSARSTRPDARRRV